MIAQKQQGITLIEILVVLLILSVGLIPAARFQGDLMQASSTTKARTQALGYAVSTLEALRIAHHHATSGAQSDIPGVGTEYQLEWQVSSLGAANRYTATVIWTDSQGHSERVVLATALYPDSLLGGIAADRTERAKAAECVFLGCP